MLGKANPPPQIKFKSSISDIVDEKDKRELYMQSLGGHELPGQSYAPFLQQSMISFKNDRSGIFGVGADSPDMTKTGEDLNAKTLRHIGGGPMDSFKKFMPRSEKKRQKK